MPSRSSASTSDILSIYTNEIARWKMLTPDQEREVGLRAMKGDLAAQEELVVRNLRFVIVIAKRYRHHGVSMMDLIQAGNIGLAHAAKKFDATMGVKFISYAVFWISQAIQKEIDFSRGAIRATQTQMGRIRRVRRLQAQCRQREGRDPTIEELMKETGYTADRIEEALSYRVNIKSLDEPVNPTEGATTTLGQVIGADDHRDEIEHEQEQREVVGRIMERVLSPREQEVLREYFGFGGKAERSLTEIGCIRGISRERARQLKERGLGKLKNACKKDPSIAVALRSVFTTAADLEARRPAGMVPRERPKAPLVPVRDDEDFDGQSIDDMLEASMRGDATPDSQRTRRGLRRPGGAPAAATTAAPAAVLTAHDVESSADLDPDMHAAIADVDGIEELDLDVPDESMGDECDGAGDEATAGFSGKDSDDPVARLALSDSVSLDALQEATALASDLLDEAAQISGESANPALLAPDGSVAGSGWRRPNTAAADAEAGKDLWGGSVLQQELPMVSTTTERSVKRSAKRPKARTTTPSATATTVVTDTTTTRTRSTKATRATATGTMGARKATSRTKPSAASAPAAARAASKRVAMPASQARAAAAVAPARVPDASLTSGDGTSRRSPRARTGGSRKKSATVQSSLWDSATES